MRKTRKSHILTNILGALDNRTHNHLILYTVQKHDETRSAVESDHLLTV